MHHLTISDEVFFKLQARRQSGGQSEEHILRHLLDCAETQTRPDRPPEGFEDATYGIFFAEGFEIFRTYKGRPYTARVVRGRWRLGGDSLDSRGHDSLNQLSQAVIDGNENAWMFWFFKAPDGTPKRIAQLRDPDMVQRRPRKRRPTGAQPAAAISSPAAVPANLKAAPAATATTTPPASRRPQPLPQPSPQPRRGGKPWEPAV